MANRASGQRSYPQHPGVLCQAAERALENLGWEACPSADGGFDAVWTSPVFRFKDDVSIRFPSSPGGTQVRVQSVSRVGKYDFGQNAKHVRQLFAELERQIVAVR